MEYKYKIDVANIEDTETLVKFQLAMAKGSEGTELDYETVREGVKAGIADDSKAIQAIIIGIISIPNDISPDFKIWIHYSS